jgi:hypothetical protein
LGGIRKDGYEKERQASKGTEWKKYEEEGGKLEMKSDD